ncbi:hypothetical protein [Atopobium sp. oral taxon 416]|uniref:hypothetical protein n=1 Tax=Atopobium sp. oral taxon 416 TaxID=712157 RepID=UPI001BA50C42|nr:hypothetical protein [Atopobium sp. oral taxon 416]QUC05036.1 hypothetical protein J4859_15525 [Atopobium sp. oral taxon 416]
MGERSVAGAVGGEPALVDDPAKRAQHTQHVRLLVRVDAGVNDRRAFHAASLSSPGTPPVGQTQH